MAYYEGDSKARGAFESEPLEKLDAISIEVFQPALSQGKTSQEAEAAILPILRRHRVMMDTPGGYGALSLTINSLEFLQIKDMGSQKKAEVPLTSNGFSAIEKYEQWSAGVSLERAVRRG